MLINPSAATRKAEKRKNAIGPSIIISILAGLRLWLYELRVDPDSETEEVRREPSLGAESDLEAVSVPDLKVFVRYAAYRLRFAEVTESVGLEYVLEDVEDTFENQSSALRDGGDSGQRLPAST